jgi:sec-independent protein translocase protein TatA
MVLLNPLLGLLPDLGGGELMLILLVVLLLFGGDKMPQLAKSIGKSLREFKKAASEVEQEIKRAIDEVPDTPSIQSTIRKAMEDNKARSTVQKPASLPAPLSPEPPASPTPTTEQPPTAPDANPSTPPPSAP